MTSPILPSDIKPVAQPLGMADDIYDSWFVDTLKTVKTSRPGEDSPVLTYLNEFWGNGRADELDLKGALSAIQYAINLDTWFAQQTQDWLAGLSAWQRVTSPKEVKRVEGLLKEALATARTNTELLSSLYTVLNQLNILHWVAPHRHGRAYLDRRLYDGKQNLKQGVDPTEAVYFDTNHDGSYHAGEIDAMKAVAANTSDPKSSAASRVLDALAAPAAAGVSARGE